MPANAALWRLDVPADLPLLGAVIGVTMAVVADRIAWRVRAAQEGRLDLWLARARLRSAEAVLTEALLTEAWHARPEPGPAGPCTIPAPCDPTSEA